MEELRDIAMTKLLHSHLFMWPKFLITSICKDKHNNGNGIDAEFCLILASNN